MLTDKTKRYLAIGVLSIFFLWFFFSPSAPPALLGSRNDDAQVGDDTFQSPVAPPQNQHRRSPGDNDTYVLPHRYRDSDIAIRSNSTGFNAKYRIAFLLPTTTNHAFSKYKMNTIDDLPMFNVLMKSFMEVVPKGNKDFSYEFYLGIPEGDKFYDREESIRAIRNRFVEVGQQHGILLSVKFYFMGAYTKGRLTWIWNYLGMEAYEHGCHYFYQYGDDVEMRHPWVKQFIGVLLNNPFKKNFGITGANDVGNAQTMTQVFVSRSHVEIFGGIYPSTIKNWYSDDFLTHVYGIQNTFWFDDLVVKNTNAIGTRYAPVQSADFVVGTIRQGSEMIKDWLRENDSLDGYVWEEHSYHWDKKFKNGYPDMKTKKITQDSVKDRFLK